MDNFEKICPSSQSANQGTDTSSAVINDDTNGNLSGGYLQKYFNGAGLLAQGTSYCLLICWEVDNSLAEVKYSKSVHAKIYY